MNTPQKDRWIEEKVEEFYEKFDFSDCSAVNENNIVPWLRATLHAQRERVEKERVHTLCRNHMNCTESDLEHFLEYTHLPIQMMPKSVENPYAALTDKQV